MPLDCTFDPASSFSFSEPTINVTPGNAASKRQSLIDEIWGASSSLPTRQPDSVDTSSSVAIVLTSYVNVDSVRQLTINMTDVTSYVSIATVWIPRAKTNRLAIAHEGHTDGFETVGLGDIIRSCLEAGFVVVGLNMPGYGFNTPDIGAQSHNATMNEAANPWAIFVEPVFVALNDALENVVPNPDEIVMFGTSGGGRLTHLCAAIDSRITKSFAIVGSYPKWLRNGQTPGTCGTASEAISGDLEQDDVLAACNILDEYILAASNGYHGQYLVQRAPFFHGRRFENYETEARERAAELGGRFEVRLDTDSGSTSHESTDKLMQHVLAVLGVNSIDTQTQQGSDSIRVGAWSSLNEGYGSGSTRAYFSAAGDGSDTATYTFTVNPGYVTVYVTYSIHSNRATDTPYEVYDDSQLLETVDVNQEVAPTGRKDSADVGDGRFVGWYKIGTYFCSSGTLKIVITDDANQFVIANGVKVHQLNASVPVGIVAGEAPREAASTS